MTTCTALVFTPAFPSHSTTRHNDLFCGDILLHKTITAFTQAFELAGKACCWRTVNDIAIKSGRDPLHLAYFNFSIYNDRLFGDTAEGNDHCVRGNGIPQ